MSAEYHSNIRNFKGIHSIFQNRYKYINKNWIMILKMSIQL